MAAEIESVESLLEKASEHALDQRELAELRRILYGKPAEWVAEKANAERVRTISNISLLSFAPGPWRSQLMLES